jgi:ribonucleoside-diphosphate reductase subunit M1
MHHVFNFYKVNFVGIGVQGLADAFILMRYPFESKNAIELNIKIFETLYYGALEASCEIAAEKGPYESYEGSPISKGVSIRTKKYFLL